MENELSLLEQAGKWAWFIAAGVFAAIEVLSPGVLAIWFAGAALAVGLLTLLLDLPLLAELGVFAVLSVAFVWGSRQFLRRHPLESDRPLLNQRASSYVGRVFTVEEAIRHGSGKLRVGDSLWLARGPDAEVGVSVRVVDVDGTALIVEPVE